MTPALTDRRARLIAGLIVGSLAAACAARAPTFVPPASGGLPAPDAAETVRAAQPSCGTIKTLTAQAALSGRIAGQRVRGRLDLGLTSDGGVRLEAIAPFGLVFVLAGERDRATLLLAREERVLRDRPAAEIVEALAGVRIAPATLLALITGCPAEGAAITDVTRFPDGILQAAAGSGRTVWVRPESSGARLVAARLGDVTVEYPAAFTGDAPRTIRLRQDTTDGHPGSDLVLAVSQIATNGPLDEAAFAVNVPATAQPVTLDELRRSGLLAGR